MRTHPDLIPTIIEKHPKSKNLPSLDKQKFLFPGSFKIYGITTTIRKKMPINKEDGLYMFVNDDTLLRGD